MSMSKVRKKSGNLMSNHDPQLASPSESAGSPVRQGCNAFRTIISRHMDIWQIREELREKKTHTHKSQIPRPTPDKKTYGR